jgi:hypothetical protein
MDKMMKKPPVGRPTPRQADMAASRAAKKKAIADRRAAIAEDDGKGGAYINPNTPAGKAYFDNLNSMMKKGK